MDTNPGPGRSDDPEELLAAARALLGPEHTPADEAGALELLGQAVAGTEPDQAIRYEILDLLVDVLAIRGQGGVLPEDLDAWIDAHDQLQAACPDDGLRDYYGGRLAVGLTQRAGGETGRTPDRDQAIELLLELVDAPVSDQGYRLEVRRLLAQQLLLRALPPGLSPYAHPADVTRVMAASGVDGGADIELAIEQLTLALDGADGLDRATRGGLAAMLSQAMLLRTVGRPMGGDLDQVIRGLARARDELPKQAPGRGELLHQLGRLRAERAARTGWPVAEMVSAVTDLSEANGLLGADHPLRPQLMIDLGQCLLQRAVLTASTDDERAAAAALEAALQLLSATDQRRPGVLRLLAPLLLKSAAARPDRIVELVREALTFPAAPRLEAELRIHLANALTGRFQQAGRDADSTEAIAQYEQAVALIPDPDDDVQLLARTALGSALADRFDARHDVQDIDLAIEQLALVDAALTRRPDALAVPGMPTRGYARSLLASARFQKAQRDELAGRPQSGLVEVVAQMAQVLAGLPPGDPMAPRIRSELDSARMLLALSDTDLRGARQSALSMVAQAEAVGPEHPDRAVLLGRAGISLALSAAAAGNLPMVDEGIGLLRRALAAVPAESAEAVRLGHTPHLRIRIPLGEALLERHRLDGGLPATLDAAIEQLELAWQDGEAHPGHPLTPLAARILARAYRRRPGPDRSAAVALAGLRAHARNVLLQNSAEHGLTAARAASDDVLLAALRCLDDGQTEPAIAALETGRALVLQASTAAGGIHTALRAAGQPELADEWQARVATPGDDPAPAEMDLRHRTLTALADSPAYQRLMSTIPPDRMAPALAEAGRDALVYLIPGTTDDATGADPAEVHAGRALVVWFDGAVVELALPGLHLAADGAPARYDAARNKAHAVPGETAAAFEQLWARLADLSDWAGEVAVGPILAHLRERISGRDPRVVLVPVGALGVVPWQVAKINGNRYAVEDLAISYASSARQLIDAAQRPRLSLADGVTFVVADPDATLPYATLGARAIRNTFYPAADYLGRPARIATAPATATEVLARLPSPAGPGAGLLEFDCHATTGDSPARSHLVLADGALTVEQILLHAAARPSGQAGGLVLLSACVTDLAAEDYDEALTLSTAFLAAGAVSVIGSRWAIDDAGTALFMYLFHHFFDHGRRSPGAALRATQRWMLDPGRTLPTGLPGVLVELCAELDLTGVHLWGAFSHHGW